MSLESASMFNPHPPLVPGENQVEKLLNQLIDMIHLANHPVYISKGDSQPILAVIDDKLALEALGDVIIVKEDRFRTGYECQTCDGEGHTTTVCTRCKGSKIETIDDKCPVCDGSGRVADLFRPVGNDKIYLPGDVSKPNETPTKQCNNCRGSGKDPEFEKRQLTPGLYPCRQCMCRDVSGIARSSGFEVCDKCRGMGSTVIIPQESVRRPNTGVVISTGDACKRLKTGDRVLYSNHTGFAITFKRNVIFRWMREDENPIRMHGVEQLHKFLE